MVLDQIRDDPLSNALKIKDNYVSGVDTFKSAGGIKDESGKPQQTKNTHAGQNTCEINLIICPCEQ